MELNKRNQADEKSNTDSQSKHDFKIESNQSRQSQTEQNIFKQSQKEPM